MRKRTSAAPCAKFGLFGAWLHKQIAANPMNQGGALQRCLWVGDADGGLGWVEMGLVEANWRRSRHRDWFWLDVNLLMCWWRQIRQGKWWCRHNLWILVRGWWSRRPWRSYCSVCSRLESANKVVVAVMRSSWLFLFRSVWLRAEKPVFAKSLLYPTSLCYFSRQNKIPSYFVSTKLVG